MKAKRTFIVLAIVVAVLALGIAYAATLSQGLSIQGSASATASDANFDVKFSDVSESVTGTGGVVTTGSSASINADDDTVGEFTFTGFTTKGQTQSATWTISNMNEADLLANVEVATPTWSNNQYFSVSVDKEELTILPNQTGTVKVTVECIKTPDDTEGTYESGQIYVGITATAAPANTQAGA